MNFNNAMKKVLGLDNFGEGVDDLDYFEKRDYDDPWHKDDDDKKGKKEPDAEAARQAASGAQPQEPVKPAYKRVELPRQEVDMTGLANATANGVPENILKRLMNIINGNLSPHILNNLNVENETHEIVESLRPQFRDYESNLRKEVLQSAAERWNKERAEIIEQLKETDDKAQQAFDEIEQLKDKIKATENSRKSTLTRYNDLQNKMQNLMTEKEKTDMENRSLQNKMKVLKMNEEQQGAADKTKEELLKLTDELASERKENTKQKERIAQLQKQVDELRGGGNAPVSSDTLAEKDAEIDNLAAQVAWLHRRLDQANEELDQANEELAQAEQLLGQIDKFEEIKNRKDEEIAQLKETVEQLRKQLDQKPEPKAEPAPAAEKESGDDAILNALDDGIEFTGKKDQDQMSLFS